MQINPVDIKWVLQLLNKTGTGSFTFRRASLKAPEDPFLSAVLSKYHHEISCLHSDTNGAAETQKCNKSICPSKSSGLNFADLIKFCKAFEVSRDFSNCL